ncbi:Lysophospholipase [Oceanobacter sp. RED65]|uniref:Lysophospholipase n=1 Tax=Bermanella marisrubri TaxID=207949 RepID=Q1N0P4_9GAMM|nr:Lysophospholipase [Oceanobacter sp. RED65] [Bermanella marisrubri]
MHHRDFLVQKHSITSQDNHVIEAFSWPIESAKACIHINHGMAEHAERYNELAMHLNTQGFSVIAHNHRGHGHCENKNEALGHYADNLGWEKVVNDIDYVRDALADTTLPYIIMGHSMGSFIIQGYLLRNQPTVDGVVLSGSNWQPTALLKAATFVSKIESVRLSPSKPSPVLQFLSFGTFNKPFKPNRTDFDWLSRDPEQVDRYINDTLCGFDCTVRLWQDFFIGMSEIFTNSGFKTINQNKPLYIYGGEKDPVGNFGKGLPKLAKQYQKNGWEDVTMKLYKDGRHEMINETNRHEVFNDLSEWLLSRF